MRRRRTKNGSVDQFYLIHTFRVFLNKTLEKANVSDFFFTKFVISGQTVLNVVIKYVTP